MFYSKKRENKTKMDRIFCLPKANRTGKMINSSVNETDGDRAREREGENEKSKVIGVCTENGNSDSQLRKVAFERNTNSTMICLVDCVSPTLSLSPVPLSMADDYLWMKWVFSLAHWFSVWISVWIEFQFAFTAIAALFCALPFSSTISCAYLFILLNFFDYLFYSTLQSFVVAVRPHIFSHFGIRFALCQLCAPCVHTHTNTSNRIPNAMNENNNSTTSKWIDKLNTW